MAPLEAAIRTAQKQFLWTTLILIVIIGVVVAVFIRRVVQRPVQRLYEGTRRIADGDLDTRIEVRGDDELARLGEAFNRMAARLGRRPAGGDRVVAEARGQGRREDRGTQPGPAAGAAHGEDGLARQALRHRGPRAEQPAQRHAHLCPTRPARIDGTAGRRRRPRRADPVLESDREGMQSLRRDRAEPAALRPTNRSRRWPRSI